MNQNRRKENLFPCSYLQVLLVFIFTCLTKNVFYAKFSLLIGYLCTSLITLFTLKPDFELAVFPFVLFTVVNKIITLL